MFPITCRVAAVAAFTAVIAACGSGAGPARHANGRVVHVVAAENFWGDVAAQLGGEHTDVTSIISDPTADPHLYESDARDAAAVAGADIVITNGAGYDDFIDKLLSTSARRARSVVRVAQVLGVSGSDANPHLWYDVPRVPEVAREIVVKLSAADPADTVTFEANLARFDASLQPILEAIDRIRTLHRGAPVAYTERVPAYLLADAGLDVKTPAGFAQSIEDGNEPSARDTKAMDDLITGKHVRVLLYNSQATSAVTQHVQDLARRAGIPVVAVSETLPKHEAHYQDWQLHQVDALAAALGG